MKFAFSTVVCPQWPIPEVVSRAEEFGFDGVDLSLDRPEDLADPAAVAEQFKAAGISIAALATPIFATGHKTDAHQSDLLRRFIDLAAALACPVVKMRDIKAHKTCGIGQASTMLAEFLAPCAQHAAQRGVQILIRNAITLRTASRLWTLLEQVDQPATVAACLDIGDSTAADESPAVSVPTLASRLIAVDISRWDINSPTPIDPLSGNGSPESPLTSSIVKQLLIRLRGIGYQKFVTCATALPDPTAGLPAALKLLKDFSTQAPPPKPPAAAKGAAANTAAKTVTAKSPAAKPPPAIPTSPAAAH